MKFPWSTAMYGAAVVSAGLFFLNKAAGNISPVAGVPEVAFGVAALTTAAAGAGAQLIEKK